MVDQRGVKMTLKNKLLKRFTEGKNMTLSGQQLATEFGVTRSAIWKAIEELREQGYVIQSVPRKGYQYVQSSKDIDAQQISLLLDENLKDLTIQFYDDVTSTNDVAKIYAVNHPNEKNYVIARKQTKGRGRYGKVFHSMIKNGIYSSLIVPVNKTQPEHIPLFTIATATAMSQAIEEVCGKRIDIKWVNDLFFNGKKISGILCEAISDIESGQITSVVIGVGLNLAGKFDDTDDLTRSVAGTLYEGDIPGELNLNELLARYLNLLNGYIEQIEKKEFIQYYSDHLLGINKTVTYKVKDKDRKGIIRGINEDGHLLVELPTGDMDELFGQEIHLSSTQFAEEAE